jgi:hypothetical protein
VQFSGRFLMSKFTPLRLHLASQQQDTLTMSFTALNALVPLPASAFRDVGWWTNENHFVTNRTQSRSWQLAGYNAEPNMKAGEVTFRRKPFFLELCSSLEAQDSR